MSAAAKVQVPWSEIDTLLLDMDGTLLDLAFDNFFWLELVPREYAKSRGLEPDAAREEILERTGAVAGTLPWYCIEHWSAEFGLDIESLKREHSHRIRFLPGATDFIAFARRLGKRLVMVTNAHQVTLSIKCDRTGVGDLMDVVVSSHDYAIEKERHAFWQRLSDEQRIEPERSLLVEDSIAILRTATSFGIRHAIAIRQPDTTREPRAVEEFTAVDGVASLIE
ncbi:MAG TPA: GMP/IMP nucleotidase [Gammaproteobacteria bacterium]|jgi:putative hydrolase of the HAD superfamily